MEVFQDRRQAGRALADRLARFRGSSAVVLGLPRGGVVVAAEVAQALGLPLDVVVVRKLGFPDHPEVAMGAITELGVRVLDEQLLERGGVSADQVIDVEERERRVLDARIRRLRGHEPAIDLTGRTAIIVDDGMATGATATVAAHSARARGAARIVVAVPVAPPDALHGLPDVDQLLVLTSPPGFFAVGAHYLDFREVGDDEVVLLMDETRRRVRHEVVQGDAHEHPVTVGAGIAGLAVPHAARGVAVVADELAGHARIAGDVLRHAGFATLTLPRPAGRAAMHARGLHAAVAWVRGSAGLGSLPLFVVGTDLVGADLLGPVEGPAAVGPGPEGPGSEAGAREPVRAVVSWCMDPRPPAAIGARFPAPTLLVVGGDDPGQEAAARAAVGIGAGTGTGTEHAVHVVEASGTRFSGPGAPAEAALATRDWLEAHLPLPPAPALP